MNTDMIPNNVTSRRPGRPVGSRTMVPSCREGRSPRNFTECLPRPAERLRMEVLAAIDSRAPYSLRYLSDVTMDRLEADLDKIIGEALAALKPGRTK